jgi:hypothetical protein
VRALVLPEISGSQCRCIHDRKIRRWRPRAPHNVCPVEFPCVSRFNTEHAMTIRLNCRPRNVEPELCQCDQRDNAVRGTLG